MKVILSRKGLDSGMGGDASPIYNNKFISIPIPEVKSGIFYRNLIFDENYNFLKIMEDLNITYFTEAHLDPDLRKSILKDRPKDWKPSFGQVGPAQRILEKHNVGKGDLFLFFGWFREVEKGKNNRFRYKNPKKTHNKHAIMGI